LICDAQPWAQQLQRYAICVSLADCLVAVKKPARSALQEQLRKSSIAHNMTQHDEERKKGQALAIHGLFDRRCMKQSCKAKQEPVQDAGVVEKVRHHGQCQPKL